MAKKDFDEYFVKIRNQYFSLNKAMQELSEEVNNNMTDPKILESFNKTIEPIKTSYSTLLYIKYLLDKPTKRDKHKKFERQNLKVLKDSKGYQDKDYIEKNDKILEDLNSK